MKKNSLLFIAMLLTGAAFAQAKPDTLIIETPKKQKIMLIADDINSFRTVKSDSLIRVALRKVSDSLNLRPSQDFLRKLSKEQRTEYFKRRNDSLNRIDGLTVMERRKKAREVNYSDKSKFVRNLKSDIPFTFVVNTGAGLVRNKVSPVFEAGLAFVPQRQDYYSVVLFPVASFIALTANRYYTFEQNVSSNSYTTFNNTFLNLSLGNKFNTKLRTNLLISGYEAGIGYLLEREGSYYGKNTIKLFGSMVTKSKFIRLTPEIYITDNFKEAFPGFSIKMF